MWLFVVVTVAVGASNRKPFRNDPFPPTMEPMTDGETVDFGVVSILTKFATLGESVFQLFDRNLVSRKKPKTVRWREPIATWNANGRIMPTVEVRDTEQEKVLEVTDFLKAVKDLWDSFTRKEKQQFILGSVIVLLGLYIFVVESFR